MSTTETKYVGPSIASLLGVLFVGLKLAKIIDWSWWLVLLPFYGTWILFFIIFCVTFVFLMVKDATKKF